MVYKRMRCGPVETLDRVMFISVSRVHCHALPCTNEGLTLCLLDSYTFVFLNLKTLPALQWCGKGIQGLGCSGDCDCESGGVQAYGSRRQLGTRDPESHRGTDRCKRHAAARDVCCRPGAHCSLCVLRRYLYARPGTIVTILPLHMPVLSPFTAPLTGQHCLRHLLLMVTHPGSLSTAVLDWRVANCRLYHR